jgi:hypothetical protein
MEDEEVLEDLLEDPLQAPQLSHGNQTNNGGHLSYVGHLNYSYIASNLSIT